MGKNVDFPVHHPRWMLPVDSLSTHLLVCGGAPFSRHALMRYVAEQVYKRRRRVAVFSTISEWNAHLGRRILDCYSSAKDLIAMISNARSPNLRVLMDLAHSKKIDHRLASLLDELSDSVREESRALRLLLVFDGVYDVLVHNRGSRCASIFYLERAVREFRKWGIGVAMSAEGLSTLTDPLRTNFWTVVHLGTRDQAEIETAALYFGKESSLLPKLRRGEALALSYESWNAEPFRLRLPFPLLRSQP